MAVRPQATSDTQRALPIRGSSPAQVDAHGRLPFRESLDLDQRLVNQVRESLEQAVFVVREMLGKDKHH